MWILTAASASASCCASVLTARNSTPRMPDSIIRLTALTPAPPTPTTRITARYAPDSAPGDSGTGRAPVRGAGTSLTTARSGFDGFARAAVSGAASGAGSSEESVWRNRSASGPSCMLARFFCIAQDLLGQLAVGLGGRAGGVVGEDGDAG